MSNYIQEQYQPVPVGVTTTVTSTSNGTGGFLCITSGTLTIKRNNAAQTVIVNAVPVTAGTWLPMPFFGSTEGLIVTTAGGASGVLGVH